MENNVVIDVEQYARSNKPIPVSVGNKYKIKVNQNCYTIDSRYVTKEQILALAGKDSNTNQVSVDYGNGNVQSVGNQSIDLIQGVIKFMITPIQAANG
jgi:hypothetical protein